MFIQISILLILWQGCDSNFQPLHPPNLFNLSNPFNISDTTLNIEEHNPWRNMLPEFKLHQPEKKQDTLDYNFLIPLNGVQYGSFVVTNSGTAPKTVSFEISNSVSPVVHIELFSVPTVPGSDGKKIADPLIPIKSTVPIEPGLTKMFFFELTGIGEGQANASIIVNGGDRQFKMNIKANVIKLYSIKMAIS